MVRYIIAVPFTFGLIAWLLYNVTKAHRTGIANAGAYKYDKKEHPFWFEFTIVVQVLFAAIFTGVLVKLLRLIIKNGI